MARVGCPDERPPGNWPEAELLHHAADAFLIHFLSTTLQFLREPPASIAWQLLLNAFDLLPQLLVVGFTLAPALLVWLVVIAAGGKPRYLAGFRN